MPGGGVGTSSGVSELAGVSVPRLNVEADGAGDFDPGVASPTTETLLEYRPVCTFDPLEWPPVAPMIGDSLATRTISPCEAVPLSFRFWSATSTTLKAGSYRLT